jgi:hypothetical protein
MLERSFLVLAGYGGEEVNGIILKHPGPRSSENVEVRSESSELDRYGGALSRVVQKFQNCKFDIFAKTHFGAITTQISLFFNANTPRSIRDM